ncbi:MAG: GspH/FimT family pseudopilin [Burkholderiales bacterium]|nr:GspH/FimT family pseudopilin [Burkholderiales bacterium]
MHWFKAVDMLEMKFHRNSMSGFTLIELLITVAIIAAAMMVAAPNMSSFMRNAELSSTANNLLASLNTARSEAMKRGMNAMVKPVDSTNWSKGWVVFVDKARNGNPSDSLNITVMSQGPLPEYFTVSGFNVKFDASGFAVATTSPTHVPNGTFTVERNDLTGTDRTKETRKVIVDLTGRVRSCKPATDSDC